MGKSKIYCNGRSESGIKLLTIPISENTLQLQLRETYLFTLAAAFTTRTIPPKKA